MNKSLSGVLILVAFVILGAETELKHFKKGFVSPQKNYEVFYLVNRTTTEENEAPKEIWIYPLKASARRPELLYVFARDADALCSPDENWIAVNDWMGSNVAEIRLFKKIDEFRYSQLKDIDPSASAWELFEKETALSGARAEFAHAYSEIKEWTADSKSFVIALTGHADISNETLDWLCTFNLKTMKAYLTPEQIKRNSNVLHSKRNKQ